MTGKKLIGMAVALAVLAGIALIQQKGARKRTPAVNREATLFQGLELNTVDGVDIFQGSQTGSAVSSVSLQKKDGVWVVDSLYDYPADFNKLADALRAASDLKIGLPVRASNVDAAEYGFDEPKTVALKSGGKEVVKVDIGAQRAASDAAGWANQHFVRKDGSDSIYLVDYDFRPFATDSSSWIDKEMLNISSPDIVSVKTADAELKEDAGVWTLVGLNQETEELQVSEANKLRSALQYLNCTSVADPAESDADLGFADPVVYIASTTNKTITVKVGGEADGGRYVRLEGDVPEKLNGWTYVVSSYKADSFLVTRDKLVKAKEDEPSEDELAQQ
ncbi:DUF4340 domain-containing protein [Tichowtungia aerotolerans]|uniref:DUF4340 domain-containing protein n=1 Tax=Tichowtungia aerotolerans TaxID=2697043 RepID=A0A6P1M2T6_9BACT|nr:DUF4340 domain-containing protein [Tichowtungia aerotolerans]QHI68147.1 DUF4340 domain-containing protein [Tichowtungia aerotolerans]